MTKKREFKDGDIYFWRYKTVEQPGSFGSYHCKSQKAIARNGVLYDTFWHDYSHRVPTKGVRLTFKGNMNDLDEIRQYDVEYYRRVDIVDMRHSNSSRATVYVKGGTKRNAKKMLEHAKYQVDQYESNIRSANQSIESLNKAIDQIKSGDLDNIYIPVCR